MSKGWISVHRQIQDHWLWKDKPFSKGQAWIDLLMMANHQENRVLIGNTPIDVERGSFITSEVKLSERWGWGRKKVRTFLEVLEKEKMLTKKSTTKYTSITIGNYGFYQSQGTTEEQQKNNDGTSEEHQRNTNNNVNNENNLLLLSISNEFPNFYKWIEENNYTKEAEHPNDKVYYLKYLHEKANFYSKTRGKNHPDTINAIKAFENKKSTETQEVILKAQSIS